MLEDRQSKPIVRGGPMILAAQQPMEHACSKGGAAANPIHHFGDDDLFRLDLAIAGIDAGGDAVPTRRFDVPGGRRDQLEVRKSLERRQRSITMADLVLAAELTPKQQPDIAVVAEKNVSLCDQP